MNSEEVALQNLKFKETEPYEKGFATYFEQKVKPELQPLEEDRLAKLVQIKKRKQWFVLFVAVDLFLTAYLVYRGAVNSVQSLAFIPMLLVVVWFAWVQAPARAFESKLKQKIIPIIAKFFGDFRYEAERGMEAAVLKTSSIINYFDHYEARDHLFGDYHGLTFEFEHAYMTAGSGKSKTTTFSGKIIRIQIPQSFTGKTIICKDSGAVGNWLHNVGSGLQRVHLEDPKFEKIFEVYSKDQIEARYLLTTAFMERLIKLTETYGSGPVQCSFFDQTLLITFSSRNSFDISFYPQVLTNLFQVSSITKSVISTAEIHQFLAQIQGVLDMIDTLKLAKRQ